MAPQIPAREKPKLPDVGMMLFRAVMTLPGFVVMYAAFAAFAGSSPPPIDPDLALRTLDNDWWTFLVLLAGLALTIVGYLPSYKREAANKGKVAVAILTHLAVDAIAIVAGFLTGNWVPAAFFISMTAIALALRGRFVLDQDAGAAQRVQVSAKS
jgi:hypothetical protein